MVRENLEWVWARIAAAAKRVGRDPADVRLIAVTKGVSVPHIEEAIACGIQNIGENRIQEAQEKRFMLRPFDSSTGSELRVSGSQHDRWVFFA